MKHGVMLPEIKQSSCYQTEADYFSITACPQVFYSSYTTTAISQRLHTLLINAWHIVHFIVVFNL